MKLITRFSVLIAVATFFYSCSNDDVPLEENVQGVFTASMTVGNINNELEGVYEIEGDGTFSLDAFMGTMSGTITSQANSDNYSISIDNSTGIFQEANNVTGDLIWRQPQFLL